MMYVIIILIGALLVLYFGGRWIAHEARELGALLRKGFLEATGNQTSDTLIRQAHAAFAERGLPPPDLVAVPREAEHLYDVLRSGAIDRVPTPELPAAICLAFAADVDSATAYLRAVSAPAGEVGRERGYFVAFDDIEEIRPIPVAPHPALASPAESVLELRATDGSPGPYHLPVDPAWGVSADDLAEHLRVLIRERQKPAGGTVILR